jgi:hypothetical protein
MMGRCPYIMWLLNPIIEVFQQMLPTIITDYFWQLWDLSHYWGGQKASPRLKPQGPQ